MKFTYKELKFSYAVPVIILALFNLGVGIVGRDIPGSIELGNWRDFAATSAFVGNALSCPVMAFAGNLGEVGMHYYGLLNAARVVYYEECKQRVKLIEDLNVKVLSHLSKSPIFQVQTWNGSEAKTMHESSPCSNRTNKVNIQL
jgi:hypothetical protein